MPSSSPKPARKGRQKIEIKKVEQKNKLQVTFSKRKLGLFRKAAQLSLLCDAQIAVIVFSPYGKIYSSGHPDSDSVLRRYLSCASSLPEPPPVRDRKAESTVTALRQQYEKAMRELEEEKKSLDAMVEVCGSGFWWNRPIEGMGLEDVEQFKECVEHLRRNLVAAAEKKTTLVNSSPPPAPAPPLTTAEFTYMSLLNGDVIGNDQAPDSWNGRSSSGGSSIVANSLGIIIKS